MPVDEEQQQRRRALIELRSTRRSKRIANLEWFEAAYNVYLSGIVGIVAVLFLSSWVGDDRVSAAGIADLRANGPAVLGLVTAVAVAVGLRSGSRGGPIALEAADVRYVLMAPIERSIVLRRFAIRSLRFAAFAGIVVGAIAGQLTARRMGSGWAPWIGYGALYGLVTGLAAIGTALVASGRRLPRWAATLAALVLIAWAVADIAQDVWSPFRIAGRIGLWALGVHAADLVAVAVVVALGVIGLLGLGGVSLEQAERRTALVGQLRFAVTLQDLRTVMVLRRQLAQDAARRRPWVRLRRPGHRLPVWRRTWQGLLRLPAPRLARMAALTAAAVLALRSAWHGTSPLIVVAGLALYLVALDAVEPLAQEIDQANHTDSRPTLRGLLYLRLLPASIVLMLLFGVLGAVLGAALEGGSGAWALAGVLVVPVILGPTAGAIISVVLGAPTPVAEGPMLLPPEVAGMKIAFRTALPLVVSVLGGVPLIAAKRAFDKGYEPIPTAVSVSLFLLVVVGFTLAWVRFRDEAKQWWKGVLNEGAKAQDERLRMKASR